ncbi:MAG: response regulator transcription factor [Anaerolineaceae bacterium]|nr:response regulator transcription factor [Anaerolineaceae bacterium]
MASNRMITTPYPNDARRRVLLIDDNPQVRQDLRLFLELPGELKVVGEATNGQEAIRLTHDLTPDAVVMDLEMPVMDGYEATRQIKSLPCPPRVIILSVYAGPDEREKAHVAGADGFLVKGCIYEDLVNAILG